MRRFPALAALLPLLAGTGPAPAAERPGVVDREALLALLRFERAFVRERETARIAGLLGAPTPETRSPAEARDELEDLAARLASSGVSDGIATEKVAALRRLLRTDGTARQTANGTGRRSPYGPVADPRPALPGGGCTSATALAHGTWSWVAQAPPGSEHAAWFRLAEAGAHAGVRLHTGGSRGDTRVEVYDGCGGPPVASSDDGVGLQSSLVLRPQPGADLRLRVSSVSPLEREAVVLTLEGAGTGSLVGHVLEAGTGLPISGTEIEIYTSTGGFVDDAFSLGDGSYAIEGLAPGTYLAVTEGSPDHIDELWDDHPCDPFCSIFTGDPIVVDADPVEIDFELEPGGAITGLVLETGGVAITDGSVRLENDEGSFFESESLFQGGRFEFRGLPEGTYFLYTSVFEHRDEVWDDVPCRGFCQPETGTPIAVTAGSQIGDLVFELERFGAVTGRITDSDSGVAVPFGRAVVYDSSGGFEGSSNADAEGVWDVGGLDSGTYFVATDLDEAYRNEVWDDIPCQQTCQPTTGHGVSVALGGTTEGIDFALDRLGGVSGSIGDEATLQPLSSVAVGLWRDGGSLAGFTSSSVLGHYEFDSLQPETYFVVTMESGAYIDELFDGLPCPTGPPTGCDPTQGTPLPIALGEILTDVDLLLTLGGTVRGDLRDAASLESLDNVRVSLWRNNGAQLSSGFTDGSGAFRFQGLPSATYFVSTDTGTHSDEAWDDVPCEPGCDPTTATPIPVTTGTTASGIDFDLTLLGGVSGRLVDDAGEPVPTAQVHVWASFGLFATGITNADGFYQIDLPSGIFRLSTRNFAGLPEELWDDVPCPDGPAVLGLCDPQSGDPVSVSGSLPVLTGLDFVLGSSLFSDGFESGDASAWGQVVP